MNRRLRIVPTPRPAEWSLQWGTASHLTPLGHLLMVSLLTISLVILGLFGAVALGRQNAIQAGFINGAFTAGEHVVQAAGKLETLVTQTRGALTR